MNSVKTISKVIGGASLAAILLINFIIVPGVLSIFIGYNIAASRGLLLLPHLSQMQSVATMGTFTVTGILLLVVALAIYRFKS